MYLVTKLSSPLTRHSAISMAVAESSEDDSVAPPSLGSKNGDDEEMVFLQCKQCAVLLEFAESVWKNYGGAGMVTRGLF